MAVCDSFHTQFGASATTHCKVVPANGYLYKGNMLDGRKLCCPPGYSDNGGDGSGCKSDTDSSYCYLYGNDLGSATPHPCPSTEAPPSAAEITAAWQASGCTRGSNVAYYQSDWKDGNSNTIFNDMYNWCNDAKTNVGNHQPYCCGSSTCGSSLRCKKLTAWPQLSPIYEQSCDASSADFHGLHEVVLVGWGVDKSTMPNTPYWVVKNSWGAAWNGNGYFQIKRGDNTAKIEGTVCKLDATFETKVRANSPSEGAIGTIRLN
jgi:hypothetical protein